MLYEINPISFVFQAAGGSASTGSGNPLDAPLSSLAQRAPFIVGSVSDIQGFERHTRGPISV
jgi:fructose-1,6-bisphosphatase I